MYGYEWASRAVSTSATGEARHVPRAGEESERAVEELRAKSRQVVVYSDVPRAQHAFEVFHSVRADATVAAIARFLAWVRVTAADADRRGRGLRAGAASTLS